MQTAPGIVLQDDPENKFIQCQHMQLVKMMYLLDRIRKDLDEDKGFHMWVVSDNLLKGAAWNSVQIAESLVKLGLV